MSENQNLLTKYKYKFQNYLLTLWRKIFKKIRYDWGKYEKRYRIIQEIIDFKKFRTYLEIGCDKDQSFSKISVERVGVDPVQGGTHKMTSDNFLNNKKF